MLEEILEISFQKKCWKVACNLFVGVPENNKPRPLKGMSNKLLA
jgi:hypothetical protein